MAESFHHCAYSLFIAMGPFLCVFPLVRIHVLTWYIATSWQAPSAAVQRQELKPGGLAPSIDKPATEAWEIRTWQLANLWFKLFSPGSIVAEAGVVPHLLLLLLELLHQLAQLLPAQPRPLILFILILKCVPCLFLKYMMLYNSYLFLSHVMYSKILGKS